MTNVLCSILTVLVLSVCINGYSVCLLGVNVCNRVSLRKTFPFTFPICKTNTHLFNNKHHLLTKYAYNGYNGDNRHYNTHNTQYNTLYTRRYNTLLHNHSPNNLGNYYENNNDNNDDDNNNDKNIDNNNDNNYDTNNKIIISDKINENNNDNTTTDNNTNDNDINNDNNTTNNTSPPPPPPTTTTPTTSTDEDESSQYIKGIIPLNIPTLNSIESPSTLQSLCLHYSLPLPSPFTVYNMKSQLRGHLLRRDKTLAVDSLIRLATSSESPLPHDPTIPSTSIKMGKLGTRRRGPDKVDLLSEGKRENEIERILRKERFGDTELRNMYKER